jgi:ketosteroid isomerase-like protein
MNEQANIQVVQQAFAYFNQGNVEGILSTLTDDVAWQLPEMPGIPYAGKRNGKAGALEFFAGLAETEDVKIFNPHTFVAQGDQVAVYGHYACIVKATGRELALDFAQLFVVRDGKIASFREYTDTAATIAAHTKAQAAH